MSGDKGNSEDTRSPKSPPRAFRVFEFDFRRKTLSGQLYIVGLALYSKSAHWCSPYAKHQVGFVACGRTLSRYHRFLEFVLLLFIYSRKWLDFWFVRILSALWFRLGAPSATFCSVLLAILSFCSFLSNNKLLREYRSSNGFLRFSKRPVPCQCACVSKCYF